ncbi:MAG: hypothetical protein NTZ78_10595 [Candidatus Aureabacteria bacterium]|nr:hypothetical protein [Candidatus Auribacterota bacterium]
MRRFIGATVVFIIAAFLCGCSVFSSKSKETDAKKERKVKVLGIPLIETKEKVEK